MDDDESMNKHNALTHCTTEKKNLPRKIFKKKKTKRREKTFTQVRYLRLRIRGEKLVRKQAVAERTTGGMMMAENQI
jgi:hypothetical protein